MTDKEFAQQAFDNSATVMESELAGLVLDLSAQLEAAEKRECEAMAVLVPNMPESGLVDACKQVKQVAVSEADNSSNLEAQLAAVQAERDELYQQTKHLTAGACGRGHFQREPKCPACHDIVHFRQSEAARGEVVKACPYCGCHAQIVDGAGDPVGDHCGACGLSFTEPAYYQRLTGVK